MGCPLAGGVHAHVRQFQVLGEVCCVLRSYLLEITPTRNCWRPASCTAVFPQVRIDPDGNIKDAGLVEDLRRRQNRRLACGADPHSKLPRLLDLKPTMGDFWYISTSGTCSDMTAEHHAVTAKHWLTRAPLSFCPEVVVHPRPCT